MITIPAIDLVDGKCVRLLKGDYKAQTTYSEDPVGQALKFQSIRFQRLHIVDLEGARDGAGKNRGAIEQILKSVRIPVQVGGGIRTSEDVERLLDWGAAFLILGTVALKQPKTVSEWINRWGAEPFIVSLDLRGTRLQVQGWIEQSQVRLEEMIDRLADWGVSQVICTDVERDGTLEEPNYARYKDLLGQLPADTSLIAAGGVSRLEHIHRLKEAGVGGAIIGKAIYEAQIPLEELARAS